MNKSKKVIALLAGALLISAPVVARADTVAASIKVEWGVGWDDGQPVVAARDQQVTVTTDPDGTEIVSVL